MEPLLLATIQSTVIVLLVSREVDVKLLLMIVQIATALMVDIALMEQPPTPVFVPQDIQEIHVKQILMSVPVTLVKIIESVRME